MRDEFENEALSGHFEFVGQGNHLIMVNIAIHRCPEKRRFQNAFRPHEFLWFEDHF